MTDPTTNALVEDIAHARGTDYFLMREQLSPNEAALLDKVRSFGEAEILPIVEPDHGSDSIALEATAQRDGDGWVINGRKRWPGNAVWCDIIVFARDVDDGRVKAFVVKNDDSAESRRATADVLSARGPMTKLVPIEPPSTVEAYGADGLGCREGAMSPRPKPGLNRRCVRFHRHRPDAARG